MLTILQGDAIEQLRTLPDESMQCCVTSPPYWGLRDYGTAAWEGGDDGCDHQLSSFRASDKSTLNGGKGVGPDEKIKNDGVPYLDSCGKCGANRIDSQLGLEKTPEEYVAKMVMVFREVRRVLRKDGTLWLNLGDSYCANGGGGESRMLELHGSGTGIHSAAGKGQRSGTKGVTYPGLKPKDLCGIPWRVAFALQADGWWLRSDIIWAKPNPMPESVTDRPTKSHEYLFLLTKSANYFYDAEAIKERVAYATVVRSNSQNNGAKRKDSGEAQWQGGLTPNQQDRYYADISEESGRNKRSVWTVATAPYPEAHFATYPPDLIKPCIMAGTSAKGCCAKCGAPWERIVDVSRYATRPGNSIKADISRNDAGRPDRIDSKTQTVGWQDGCKCESERRYEKANSHLKEDAGAAPLIPCTVLDPFAGSGTTGMAALELGRKAVLIELNPKYCDLIRQRCDVTPGLQLA